MSGHVSRSELIEAISRVAAVEDFESMRSAVADCRKLLDRLREPPRRSDDLTPGAPVPKKSPARARHGTHHFATIAAADAYYRKQGYTTDAVVLMISEGVIAIGRPAFLPHTQTAEADEDGRYFITSPSFE